MSRIVALGAVLGASVVLGAQQVSPPAFRGGIELVQVDVTVLDHDRRPVHGLTAADFTVREDGAVRPIGAVAAFDLPEPAAVAAPWMRETAPDVATNDVDARRLVTIIIDDANTGGNYNAMSASHQKPDASIPDFDPWIGKAGIHIAYDVVDHLGANDLAAVLFTFMGKSQNFTIDRAKLHAAIDSYHPKTSGSAGQPLGCQFRGQIGDCALDAMQRVAHAMPTSPPRRKVLVYIGQGLKLDVYRAIDDASGGTYSAAADVITALQEANVTMYVFSPGGLQVSPRKIEEDNLIALAETTGGRATMESNVPWEAVPQMFRETSSYYVIGYEPAKADGRLHSIKVQVNRPGLEAVNRHSVRVPGPKLAAPAAGGPGPSSAEQALASAVPKGDMRVAINAVAFPNDESKATVLVDSAIAAPAGMSPRSVELIATVFDQEWHEKGTVRQTLTVDAPARASQLVPVEAFSRLTLPPGRYELRVAASSGSLSGGMFTDLDVPDFAKAPLTVSGPVIGTMPTWAAGPEAAYTDLLPMAPTVRRDFTHDNRVTAFVRLHEGGKRAVTGVPVEVSLRDESNHTVRDDHATLAPAAFDAHRTADYKFDVPVAGLGAGEYLLTFVAGDGQAAIRRQIRFTVR